MKKYIIVTDKKDIPIKAHGYKHAVEIAGNAGLIDKDEFIETVYEDVDGDKAVDEPELFNNQ